MINRKTTIIHDIVLESLYCIRGTGISVRFEFEAAFLESAWITQRIFQNRDNVLVVLPRYFLQYSPDKVYLAHLPTAAMK